jgi:hypothetical protein
MRDHRGGTGGLVRRYADLQQSGVGAAFLNFNLDFSLELKGSVAIAIIKFGHHKL